MRKFIFLFLFLPITLSAQTPFGFFSYENIVKQLPQYEKTNEDFKELQARFDAELQRNEEELTRRYVAFINGQRDFPEPILRKRQKEIQELMDQSIDFRDQVKNWLQQAQDSLFSPLRAIVNDAVAKVCVHNNLAYIIDTDKAGYAFINPQFGFNITNALLGTLGIQVSEPQVGEQQPSGQDENRSESSSQTEQQNN